MKNHLFFQDQSPEKLQNFSLKILSYNVFLRPPPVKNNNSDYKDDRCEEFLKHIHNYDILCLQEIFGFLNKRKNKIIKRCFKNGFHFNASSVSPSFFSTFLVDGGLLTLSKFPIVATEFTAYKYCILTDSLSHKGVLYTKILIKDQILHLFNTHTQASYMGKDSDRKASIKTRIDQFYEMRKFIVTMLRKYNFEERHVVLIAGDFNLNARNAIHPIEFVNNLNFDNLKNKEFYDEYEYLLNILAGNKDDKDKILDLLKLNTPGDERPPTYGIIAINGNGEKVPAETALTLNEDLMSDQSLDYFLQLIPKGIYDGFDNIFLKTTKSSALDINYSSVKIEKFEISNKPYTQLSDHYGLSLVLSYKYGNEEVSANEMTSLKLNHKIELNNDAYSNNYSVDSVIINISKDQI